ncbi:outer membrane beta-barrel protein [Aquimarina sp. 2-A2]|uniref:outer membrane beta-barrel protein n=1 Tax=Aquimarina sp. 2-A2 TaxID=3382644 RepID=UPI00387EEFCA
MKDKKHIDRLFQEKFKDFDVSPNAQVWERIQASQKEDRKPLILPFWYRIAGVASVVLLLSTIAIFWLNPFGSQTNLIVDTPEQDRNAAPVIVDTTAKPENPEIEITKAIVADRKNITSKSENNQQVVKTDKVNSNTTTSQNSLAVEEKTDRHPLNSNRHTLNNPVLAESDTINFNEETARIATSSQKDSKKEAITLTDKKSKVSMPDAVLDTLDTTAISENSKEVPEALPTNENSNKKSLFDAIKSGVETEVAENDTRQKRWNVTPNIAPVYYSSIGNGSSIDPQFKDNNKDGQVNMSYGIQIAYAVNKRIKVRSGVNKVDLSYNTEGIGFGPSIVGRELQSVNYNTVADEIEITDFKSPKPVALDVNGEFINKKQNVGFLNQRLNYIEVPLEIEYALISKKIAVQMIGGLSTLFLNGNEISVQSGDSESSIGTANNLNPVSFSGNIGVGLDYNLSNRFQINVEPIFKYQLNAFSKNDGNFKPYYFGVYTGINFKF